MRIDYYKNIESQKKSHSTFTENAKNTQFGEFLNMSSFWSNSVTRHVNFNRTKIGENAKMEKFK